LDRTTKATRNSQKKPVRETHKKGRRREKGLTTRCRCEREVRGKEPLTLRKRGGRGDKQRLFKTELGGKASYLRYSFERKEPKLSWETGTGIRGREEGTIRERFNEL